MVYPPETRRHPELQPLEVAEELLQLLAGTCEIRRTIPDLMEDAETASEQHEQAMNVGRD